MGAEIHGGRGFDQVFHDVGSQRMEQMEQSSVTGHGPGRLLRYHGGVGRGPCLRQGGHAGVCSAAAEEAPAKGQSQTRQGMQP